MITERISALRAEMKKEGIRAWIVPSTDAHQSEYVPALWQRRPWISGFTGSAGDVIVTTDKAALWTDGRYFAQAEQELAGSGIELMRIAEKSTPTQQAFLREVLKEGESVAIDPKTLSHSQARSLLKDLQQAGLKVKFIEQNLVDRVWKDQPAMPSDPLRVHPKKYAGESHKDKLKRVRAEMDKHGADAHVITMLDAIAWLFNLRGSDVEFNPVFIAYAIVDKKNAYLFVREDKLNDKVRKHLGEEVQVYDYGAFKLHLQQIAQTCSAFMVDASATNHWIVSLIEKSCRVIDAPSPVTKFKAIKNKKELDGLRACHVRDGVAMVQFLHWLEPAVKKGGVTELSAAQKLEQFRARQEMFIGPSFNTISSYKIHGGIIHYAVSAESDIPLQPESIYLIDSGGQYENGTTDITRTVALGKPSKKQKEQFTRVLMGHIDLELTSFPEGTTGPALDTITRRHLWQVGLNFKHGTGHGIGAALCVHEGPASINPSKGHGVAVEAGMVFSNEPGYYEDGQYGIRTENLIIVNEDKKNSSDAFKFLCFENITMCPIDLRLVDKDLLKKKHVRWLNAYHREVREKLSPHLSGEEKKWLKEATKAI